MRMRVIHIVFGSILLAILGTAAFYIYRAYAKTTIPDHGPYVSFNFDDGFLSAYNIAIPMLEKEGWPATEYVITGNFHRKGYINEEQVIDLESHGFEIGAHTRTHPALANITDPDVMRNEILGSKRDLENIGVKSVTTFAYPEGSFNSLAEEIVKESGFVGARITQPLLNNNEVDRYALRRQRLQYDTTFAEAKNAIDEAVKKKEWVIFVMHRIDEKSTESISHQLLGKIIDEVKKDQIPVITNTEGLKLLQNID